MAVWVFGYGSLIWRPGFAFEERRPASVLGFVRRLHQGSPDHRGTPAVLGRVATLVPAPGEICGGVAYRLRDDHAQAILAELDVREQGGYQRLDLPATLRGASQEVNAVTWVGWPDNPFHLGPAPFEEMVTRIREARGPSGNNLDYVIALDDALRGLEWHDPHVGELAAALRRT